MTNQWDNIFLYRFNTAMMGRLHGFLSTFIAAEALFFYYYSGSTLGTAFINLFSMFISYPTIFVVNYAIPLLIVYFSASLPDVDAADSHYRHDWNPARLMSRNPLFVFTYAFVYKPLSMMTGNRATWKHRGVMHTPIGLAITSCVWGVIILFVAKYVGGQLEFYLRGSVEFSQELWVYFSCLPLSYGLHIIEDSLTVTGVRFFGRVVRGVLVTGKTDGLFVWAVIVLSLSLDAYFASINYSVLVAGPVSLSIFVFAASTVWVFAN